MSESTQTIRIHREDGVAWLTIDAPPMNLLGGALFRDLGTTIAALAEDTSTRVVVLRSADSDFFIAHGDVEVLAQVPVESGPPAESLPMTHQMLEGLRQLPQVSIAQIEGFARGGGSEVALACDMRFAARDKAVFGQPEIALGILPGAGGTVRLARLVGRARASEIILGGDDFSAEEAERYGWINRALPPNELAPFVDRLARRIARFPAVAIREAKRTLQSVTDADTSAQLLTEQNAFDRLMADPRSERVPRMQRFLDRGMQSREGERSLGADCTALDEA